MRYSEETIQEVLSRNNIIDVIGQYVKLKRSGGSYVGLCPFHAEKTPSFNVSESKQVYYCFGCHAGGNVITFLMEYNNFTFQEAIQYLAERAGMELPEVSETPEQRSEQDQKSVLLEIYKKSAAFYYYQLKREGGRKGLSYLKDRRLTDETIRHFGLGYSGRYGSELYRYLKGQNYSDQILKETGLFLYDERKGFSDKFWNRVMFPIMDVRGRVIGFGGRVMGDGKPKYLNSPETMLFNKRKNLYALNYARSTRKKYMILCEGYMDVITMHQAGFTNAVASLGTALTEEQAALLHRFTHEVLLLYDSDNAGTMAALRAAPILRNAGISSRVVRLEPHKDPDEFIKSEGAEAFQERLDKAQNSFLFETDQLQKEYRMDDPAGRTAFQHELARRLASFTEPLERENYIESSSVRYHLSKDALTSMTNRFLAAGTPAESYRRPRSGRERAENMEDARAVPQKLLLTYLSNDPSAFSQIQDAVSPEDFSDEFCRKIAEKMFRQIEQTGSVNEAEIIAGFSDSESQKACAALLHTSIPIKSEAELDQAFTDCVRKVMQDGNVRRGSSSITDAGQLQRLIVRKHLMEDLESGKRKLHLSDRRKETQNHYE